jgi:hypothetical protein
MIRGLTIVAGRPNLGHDAGVRRAQLAQHAFHAVRQLPVLVVVRLGTGGVAQVCYGSCHRVTSAGVASDDAVQHARRRQRKGGRLVRVLKAPDEGVILRASKQAVTCVTRVTSSTVLRIWGSSATPASSATTGIMWACGVSAASAYGTQLIEVH